MFNAKIHSLVTVVLFCCCIALVVSLINERSKDTVRFTVTSADMYGYDLAPTVHYLQAVTGKEAIAIPLNGTNTTATKWRLVLEDRK